jgi:hypothetical protein
MSVPEDKAAHPVTPAKAVPIAETDPGLRWEDKGAVIFRELELDTFASR